MMRLKRMAFAGVMGALTASVMGQMSIEPPEPSATQASTAPAIVAPRVEAMSATSAPATMPSAQNVLEGLLKDKPEESAIPNPVPAAGGDGGAGGSRIVESPVAEVAPNAPKSTRIREGEFVWNKTGRLVKDEKNGGWIFSFEADGKAMKDPPMRLIPSRLLKVMQDASGGGAQPMRFKVSGLVTEYEEKNYLWVQHVEILRELNKGIGG